MIATISQTGIAGRCKQSREGLLWVLPQEINYLDLQHAHSAHGKKVLLKAPVDGFHEATNTFFQFRESALTEEDMENRKEILYYDVTSEYPFVNS